MYLLGFLLLKVIGIVVLIVRILLVCSDDIGGIE